MDSRQQISAEYRRYKKQMEKMDKLKASIDHLTSVIVLATEKVQQATEEMVKFGKELEKKENSQ